MIGALTFPIESNKRSSKICTTSKMSMLIWTAIKLRTCVGLARDVMMKSKFKASLRGACSTLQISCAKQRLRRNSQIGKSVVKRLKTSLTARRYSRGRKAWSTLVKCSNVISFGTNLRMATHMQLCYWLCSPLSSTWQWLCHITCTHWT